MGGGTKKKEKRTEKWAAGLLRREKERNTLGDIG